MKPAEKEGEKKMKSRLQASLVCKGERANVAKKYRNPKQTNKIKAHYSKVMK